MHGWFIYLIWHQSISLIFFVGFYSREMELATVSPYLRHFVFDLDPRLSLFFAQPQSQAFRFAFLVRRESLRWWWREGLGSPKNKGRGGKEGMGRSNTESEKENIIFLKLVNWFFLDIYFLLLPFIFGVQNGKHLCPEVPRKAVLFHKVDVVWTVLKKKEKKLGINFDLKTASSFSPSWFFQKSLPRRVSFSQWWFFYELRWSYLMHNYGLTGILRPHKLTPSTQSTEFLFYSLSVLTYS